MQGGAAGGPGTGCARTGTADRVRWPRTAGERAPARGGGGRRRRRARGGPQRRRRAAGQEPSSIVEGYRVEVERPPPWLSVTVPEIRLCPGTARRCGSGWRCGRTRRSSPSACACGCGCARRATSGCTRTSRSRWSVPRVGGPATIRTEPAVVRLRDALRGRFTVHRGQPWQPTTPAGHVLSAPTTRGSSRFELRPRGGRGPARRRRRGPGAGHGPAAGRGGAGRAGAAPRGRIDDGAGLVAVVRLIQETSAAPVEVPVRLRLEPSALRTIDSPVAELQVVVDNRGGQPGTVRAARRARPGEADRVRVPGRRAVGAARRRTRHARAGACPGAAAGRAGGPDVHGHGDRRPPRDRVAGHWEQRAAVSPIATAAIRLEPEGVRVRNWPDAHLSVLVDNQRGPPLCASACRVRIPRARSGSPSSPRSSTSGPGGSGARTCRWSRRRPRTARSSVPGPAGARGGRARRRRGRPARCTSTARLRRSRRPGSPSNRSGS